MSREIKFRAWDGKQMTTSGIMFNTSTGCLEVPTQYSLSTQSIPENKRLVLMQFTGLHDKNGKEVYHKDLLKGFGKQWIVEWQNEEARFLILASTGNSDQWKFMDEVDRMEIIGNIYENPELLKATA